MGIKTFKVIFIYVKFVWAVFKVSFGSIWQSFISRVFDGQVKGAASLQRWWNQVLLGYQVRSFSYNAH